jgi:hypothetical protein
MPSLQNLEVWHEEIHRRKFSHWFGSMEAAEQLDQGLQELGTGLKLGIWRVREEPEE